MRMKCQRNKDITPGKYRETIKNKYRKHGSKAEVLFQKLSVEKRHTFIELHREGERKRKLKLNVYFFLVFGWRTLGLLGNLQAAWTVCV